MQQHAIPDLLDTGGPRQRLPTRSRGAAPAQRPRAALHAAYHTAAASTYHGGHRSCSCVAWTQQGRRCRAAALAQARRCVGTADACAPAHTHMRMCAYSCTRAHAPTRTHSRVLAHTHTHTHIHKHKHKHTHVHAHVYAHAHTCTHKLAVCLTRMQGKSWRASHAERPHCRPLALPGSAGSHCPAQLPRPAACVPQACGQRAPAARCPCLGQPRVLQPGAQTDRPGSWQDSGGA